MEKAIPQDERFDPNRFFMLRLGSTIVTPTTSPNPSTSTSTSTTTTTTRSDSQDRVIFADPCSMCGTKKRRSSPRQESIFNPRKKKFLVESASIKDPNPITTATGGTTTLQGSDPLVRSIYGSIPFPLPSSPITSPVPKTSSISSTVATIQRCNSAPPESIPSPNSPVIAFGSIQTPPPSQPPVGFRDRINSVSGSPQMSPELSPANALLPPRPPTLRRSSSAPIPSIMDPIATIGETVSGTTFLGSPDSVTATRTGTGTEESPSRKRWKRMRESLAEIKKWVEEQETYEGENNKSEEIKDVKKGEGYEVEDNVTVERDGNNFSSSREIPLSIFCFNEEISTIGDHPKRAMDVKEQKIPKGENKGRVVDRISELPDSLVHHILSFLPIKQVVITSILSKRWRYLWASLPILNFKYLEPYTSNQNLRLERARKFMNFVERFLFGHDMNIQKLNLDIEGEIDESCVNAYISKVIRHKVQDLSLNKDFWFEHFVFPPNLITCESLLKLTIYGNFVFKFPSSTCFPSLKILSLSNFEFSDDFSTQQLFSNCPVLEELTICRCKWDDLSILCILGPVLKRLKINDYQNEWGYYYSDCVIKINAPNLEYLSYFCYLPIDFDLCNFSSLAYAEICLKIQESESSDAESESGHCASKLFGALSNVNVLNISDEMFEILSNTKDLLTHNPKFHNLIRLEVNAKHYDLSGRALLDLLQIMPNLECLIFDELSTNNEYWTYEKVPQCLLLHLKEVKIKKFGRCKTEFYVLKFLLENAKVLERMTISSCYSMRDPPKKLKIMNMLLMVARGSTNCVIEFS